MAVKHLRIPADETALPGKPWRLWWLVIVLASAAIWGAAVALAAYVLGWR